VAAGESGMVGDSRYVAEASLMPSAVRLHVTSEILAVSTRIADPGFIAIPAGSIIETSDDLAEPGFHTVMFNGKDLLAFTRDIHERTRGAGDDNR
jgi:hypothetical protein